MTDEELRHAIPQYKAFLWAAPLPYLVFFFGNRVGIPVWAGVLALVAIVLMPLASLWFSLPVAKKVGRPMLSLVLLTLLVPFGFVIGAVPLLRRARNNLGASH